jgi:hypothetical protein
LIHVVYETFSIILYFDFKETSHSLPMSYSPEAFKKPSSRWKQMLARFGGSVVGGPIEFLFYSFIFRVPP